MRFTKKVGINIWTLFQIYNHRRTIIIISANFITSFTTICGIIITPLQSQSVGPLLLKVCSVEKVCKEEKVRSIHNQPKIQVIKWHVAIHTAKFHDVRVNIDDDADDHLAQL